MCLWLMAANLDLVSGSKSRLVQTFPGLLVMIGVAGAGLALWVKA